MGPRLAILLLGLLPGLAALAGAAEFGKLTVNGTSFELTRETGPVLRSPDLIGVSQELAVSEGQSMTFRIDGVTASPEDPEILLHNFSYLNASNGQWSSLCDPDREDRRVGFPAGWDLARGRPAGRSPPPTYNRGGGDLAEAGDDLQADRRARSRGRNSALTPAVSPKCIWGRT